MSLEAKILQWIRDNPPEIGDSIRSYGYREAGQICSRDKLMLHAKAIWDEFEGVKPFQESRSKEWWIELFKANKKKVGESATKYCRRIGPEGVSVNTVKSQYWRTLKEREGGGNNKSEAKAVEEKIFGHDAKVSVVEKDQDGELRWELKGHARITTFDQALAASGVDLQEWEIKSKEWNTWPTTISASKQYGYDRQWQNVQVKINFQRRQYIDLSPVRKELKRAVRKLQENEVPGSGVMMVATADFHMGAYINDLMRSPDFNISVLVNYLSQIADIVNSYKKKEVHLAMLGDFIESFTGLNHKNSWKGLSKGAFGTKAITLLYEVLRDSFLNRINNLTDIYIVSGNHDRVTSEKEGDEKGEVAEMLAYMLKESSKVRCTVHYHPMLLSVIVDGINYIMTHGHLGLSKKDIAHIILDHQLSNKVYRVFMKGHSHSREVKEAKKKQILRVEKEIVVQMDDAGYRGFTIAPLFTGNFYSESLGYSSSAGFRTFVNNGKGGIITTDYML